MACSAILKGQLRILTSHPRPSRAGSNLPMLRSFPSQTPEM